MYGRDDASGFSGSNVNFLILNETPCIFLEIWILLLILRSNMSWNLIFIAMVTMNMALEPTQIKSFNVKCTVESYKAVWKKISYLDLPYFRIEVFLQLLWIVFRPNSSHSLFQILCR